MAYEKHAGPCAAGKRHVWAQKETRVQSGVMCAVAYIQCQRCPCVKVLEYTRRGNHIAGYLK